ncbi:hypothetical protein FHQ18_09950 [Deferribacter autotrophicus]|uniref:Prepilin-type N-terminal cleavage/methylation domain-containing protein n=1 Tax=Deferribacter autotrophicus TaxID=500465 RepID=A0A5A8F489_9BACT|nr:prepilin-type N-terminal cleavage/methylation domain-containing protein [Deferribacter autotrophicus]KAA0257360.1 hypothetical protein FHQ18_09950 [Deferribacter autotrophicus]
MEKIIINLIIILSLLPYLFISLFHYLPTSLVFYFPTSLSSHFPISPSKKGFTLVELVIIIVLIGILAIVVAPKIEIDYFKTDADFIKLYSDIRFVQHKSMVSGGGWKITFDGANKKYTIYDNDGNIAQVPSGDNPVELKNSFSSNKNELFFDYLGRPDSDNISTNDNILTDNTTIRLGNSKIIIIPYSGGIVIE